MFATCLFCNGALGRNECIETFPVGRRIAFDSAKGRLWVICPSCVRWNLSPLETRWEAIDEAERCYRDARLRTSTENVGLARLRDGTELVRIGSPLLPEFAAWRYGKVFRQRLSKYRRIEWGFSAMLMVPTASALVGMGGGMISLAGSALWLGGYGLQFSRHHRRLNLPRIAIRANDGALLRLSDVDAAATQLVDRNDDQWTLRVVHRAPKPGNGIKRTLLSKSKYHYDRFESTLGGTAARDALRTMLPSVNYMGGYRGEVDQAVDALSNHRDLAKTFLERTDSAGRSIMKLPKLTLAGLPGSYRLAMEMKLHEEDERRAMEGEMAQLEQRWREAEEIASISDGLLLPPEIDDRLHKLHEDDLSRRLSSPPRDQ